MSSSSIAAIDVHAHYGNYSRQGGGMVTGFMSATADEVVARASRFGITLSIASPLQGLLPRGGGDPVAGNIDAAAVAARLPALKQYVVIDPRVPETFIQAEAMLRQPGCVGIKIHPEEHVYPVAGCGGPVFEFAARHRAVILAHTSEQNSLCSDLVPFADRFPEVTLILAHIGNGWDGDYGHQVRGVLASRHGNVVADTSSARSITPHLIEWAVREVGAERVLFGTDSPLYHCGMQRSRIDQADLSDDQKRLILRDNALRIFGGKLGL